MPDLHVRGAFLHSPSDQAILGVALAAIGVLALLVSALAATLVLLGFVSEGLICLATAALIAFAARYVWTLFQGTKEVYVLCHRGLLVSHPSRQPLFLAWKDTERVVVRNVLTCFEVIGANGHGHARIPFSIVADPNRAESSADDVQRLLLSLAPRQTANSATRKFERSFWDLLFIQALFLVPLVPALIMELVGHGASSAAFGLGAAIITLLAVQALGFFSTVEVTANSVILASPIRRREIPFAQVTGVALEPYDRWRAIYLALPDRRVRLPCDRRGLIQLYDVLSSAWTGTHREQT